MLKYITLFTIFLSLMSFSRNDKGFEMYAGTYHFPTGSNISSVVIKTKNKQLNITGNFGSSLLVPTKIKDQFTLLDFEGKAIFIRDSSQNKIIKLHLIMNNVSFDEEGDKIDFDDYGTKEKVFVKEKLSNKRISKMCSREFFFIK